jgi:hypothetical protein
MDINYIGIVIAGVVGMVVGFLWYGPVFGKLWIELSNFKQEDMDRAKEQGMTKYYAYAFLGSLVTAFVLDLFMNLTQVSGFMSALLLAFWAWLGFVVTTLLSNVLWEGKSVKVFLLNIAYYLVMLIAMATVLSLWS